jgi:hypothetical protein
MTFGFVMIRHVCNKATDLYWKESYHCIRRWYPDTPIMIVDDSSNREFLQEDMVLTNCTVIYDRAHRGSAELLPYYYFHLIHPFDVAVIIHDGVFIQRYVDFTLENNEPCRFLWNFPHWYDDEIFEGIKQIYSTLPFSDRFTDLYHRKDAWQGCFGVMSVIRWNALDHVNRVEEGLFDKWLAVVKTRDNRHALERAFPLLMTYHYPEMRQAMFGGIYDYIRWGVTFTEYITGDFSQYPVMKVWTAR